MDYFVNQESFDELLDMMMKYNVFTYGITKTGEKGYEYSKEFRAWLLKCIDKAKSINYNEGEREFLISTLMTFTNIPLKLADDMSCVIRGRNDFIQKNYIPKESKSDQ